MVYMNSIVVAYDKNRGIGANNDLLWQRDLPADLKHFKELTTGKSIIMGRKTFESIGRPLPHRENIIVSRSLPIPEGATVAHDLKGAYAKATEEIVIIGGASIYEQALADTDIVYATEVDAVFPEAEVFFPALGGRWHEIAREHHDADERNKYAYDFVTYEREA